MRDSLPDGSQAKGMVTEQSQQAVERGLRYLASQQRGDGSWGTGQYVGNVAVTSLGALAFLAGGHVPGRGPFGKAVTNAVNYVLAQEVGQEWPGYLAKSDRTHGPMYGHGFGTLLLGETHGMVNDPRLTDSVGKLLGRAVNLIVKHQSPDGGWRYHPWDGDSDISVTVCQMMALRSARNAGIYVPKSTVNKCVEYVLRSQDKKEGWFHYKIGDPGGDRQSFARTAAGLSALYSAGFYGGEDLKAAMKAGVFDSRVVCTGDEINAALRFLMKEKPRGFPGNRPDMYYFYGHYYAAQAMWTAGGDYWNDWFPLIREDLVAGQRHHSDGSWPDACPHYGTAMACLCLQVPNNYLPIMQK
jgi:hypothetical protein